MHFCYLEEVTQKELPNILLIESESRDLDYLLKLLGRFPCRVTVSSGDLAPSWPNDGAEPLPDLLMLDLHTSNSLRLLQEMRRDAGATHIPVIVLTNSIVEKHVLDSFELGRYTCAVKPLSYVKLLYAFTSLGIKLPGFGSSREDEQFSHAKY